MSMETPLGKVRGSGSAGTGTRHWWLQRITAVALLPLVIWFVAGLVGHVGADRDAVTDWIAQPLVAVLMLLLIGTGMFHLRLGIQEVVEDYVHSEGLKVVSRIMLTLACAAVAAVSAFAVLKIAL